MMKKLFPILLISFCLISSVVTAQSNFTGAGISMKFNGGLGNYVDLGDTYNSLNFPFAFEAWINPTVNPANYGGVFGTDNSLGFYYGLWIRVRPNGTIDIEFGNGEGAGFQYRRGYVTVHSIPLNRWTHLAVSFNSVTDITVYWNGVQQSIVPTDGGSTSSAFVHSSAPASIGRTINTVAESNFNGQIDEVRLWNTARTETQIRDFMCTKIDPNSSGLIGYWTSDESYNSSTIIDNSTTGADGTTVGLVQKATSGAAIGDASEYLYTSNWSGVKVSIDDASGDRMTAKNITGNPSGVHVYRVDAAPYNDHGLDLAPDFYFGIFCAEGNTVAKYKAVYKYTENNGVVTSDNDSLVDLMGKNNDMALLWKLLDSHTGATGMTRQKNQSSRGEYIINVPPSFKLSESTVIADPQLSVFPNPASQVITLDLSEQAKDIRMISVMDLTGRILKSFHVNETGNPFSIDVSDLTDGLYLAEVETATGRIQKMFEVQR